MRNRCLRAVRPSVFRTPPSNDRSTKHPFVKRDMITCVRKRPIGFGVLFCENNGVPSREERECEKNGKHLSVLDVYRTDRLASSPRTKMKCSQQRAPPLGIQQLLKSCTTRETTEEISRGYNYINI